LIAIRERRDSLRKCAPFRQRKIDYGGRVAAECAPFLAKETHFMTDCTDDRLDLRRQRLQGRLLVSHFLAYCIGVCLFVMVNTFLGGSAWFQWPSLVWGSLLVAHVFTVVAGGMGRPSVHG
jgi:2TM domain